MLQHVTPTKQLATERVNEDDVRVLSQKVNPPDRSKLANQTQTVFPLSAVVKLGGLKPRVLHSNACARKSRN